MFIIIDTIIVFITSLFVGSFFGVLVDRTVRGEQFVKGKSYCESCKHQLNFLDLIPLFSYIFLRGKCRYCKSKISPTLFFIELTAGTVFAFITYSFLIGKFLSLCIASTFLNISLLVVFILLTSLLILTFFTDLKYQVIPDIYLWGIALLSIPYFYLIHNCDFNSQILLSHLASGAWLFIFFWILHVAFKGKAMGEGDIYLASGLGLYLQWQDSIVMWFFAFLIGAIYGVGLVLFKKKNMKTALPFGPFLIVGWILALIWGSQLINFYLNFLT